MSPTPWNDRPSRDWLLWSLSFLFHLAMFVAIGSWSGAVQKVSPVADDRVIGVSLRPSLPARESATDALPDDSTEPHDAERSEQEGQANQQASLAGAGVAVHPATLRPLTWMPPWPKCWKATGPRRMPAP